MSSRLERKLLQLFASFEEKKREQLVVFAEFLATHGVVAEKEELKEPLNLPRPENESVVASMKRLSKNYSMLDKMKVFPGSSDLMTQHIMRGRPAEEVIDELEVHFKTEYEKYVLEITADEK